MTAKQKFARAVYKARTTRGKTQAQIAEAVDISIRWFQKIEKGELLPGTDTTIRLATTLDIDLNILKSEPPLLSTLSS